MSSPQLIANDDGVLLEHYRGEPKPFGILWDEIVRVSAYKELTRNGVRTVLELEFWWEGEGFDFDISWAGANDVLAKLPGKLPGLHSNWVAELRKTIQVGKPMVVWTRRS